MNSLSWFLYLADVIGNVKGVLILFCIISGSLMAVWSIAKFGFHDDEDAVIFVKSTKHLPYFFLFCTLLASIIPSRDTIYLIAGSEAGETVVTSEAGKEILEDIQEVIRYQLGKLKGTENKSSSTP